MRPITRSEFVPGPAGAIECAIDEQADHPPHGVAVVAHPLPTMGGTMDNKVVGALARAFVLHGLRAVRFNFRGVGQSAGAWDEGRGEVDDLMAVIDHYRQPDQPFYLAGFSFGGYTAAAATARLGDAARPDRLVLVGPAVGRFQVAAVPADTVVIHGEQDDVVPLAAVLDWARPQTLPITVVPGVGHFFHGQLTLLKTLVGRELRAASG
ncbi:alpha/beta hydrolase [Aquabacterium sp.]|uniref:alpha/beta hydrolase n=1 Tax=Aquabacterium sp. TaxID=1872578 RepID=UPI0035AE7317